MRTPRLSGALVLCALVLLLTLSTAQGQPSDSVAVEGATLVEVRFEGLENLKAEELMARIESREGTEFDTRKVRSDLKRLAEQAMEAGYAVSRADGGLRLTFILRENPVLDAIRFVGNSRIKTRDLEKLVRVRPGDVITRGAVSTAREAVQREYRTLGYMRTEVRADLVRGPDGGEVLQVFVNEGRKVKTKDLSIQGNASYSSTRLRLMIETKGSWGFVKNYFDEGAFEDDLERLRQFYLSEGFFNAKVERGAFQYDESDRSVSPAISIVEGPRYRMGEVAVAGNASFTIEEIEAPFQKIEGDYFEADAYQKTLSRARGLYENAGYLTTEIVDEIDLDRDRGLVNVTLRVEERPRVRVGRVLVERSEFLVDENASWFGRIYNGVAPPVSNETIQREVTLAPGEVYDRRKEEESIERLRRLGIFENVKIESRSTGDPNVRDAVVKVEEGVTGNIILGVGYADSFGGYVFGNYTERNFLGKGDLRLNLMVGTREINGAISYFQRYLGDSDNSLFTEIHRTAAKRPGYDETNTGAQVEIGMPIDEQWKSYLRARFEYAQLDENGYNPTDEDFNRAYPVGALRLKFTHDTRRYGELGPGSHMPLEGHLGAVSFEGGYADGPLAVLAGSYEWYKRLGENLLFATDLSAAIMPVDADRIGPTERLYLGGTRDLRGFAFRGAGPKDSNDEGVALGGATKLLARNELRYPLFDNLTGVFFLDAGMLSHDAFSLSSPRASTGLGLRLALKGVQVGVDGAFPILSQSDDTRRYFHFNMSGIKGFGSVASDASGTE